MTKQRRSSHGTEHRARRAGSPGASPTAGSPAPPEVTVDRDEILVVGTLAEPDARPRTPTTTRRAAACAARIEGFREDTRAAAHAHRRRGRGALRAQGGLGRALRRRRGGVHQPERPGDDPPAHARAAGARHARRRRRRPEPQRRAGVVRAARQRARGRVDRRSCATRSSTSQKVRDEGPHWRPDRVPVRLAPMRAR